jgi:hypothetical protein
MKDVKNYAIVDFNGKTPEHIILSVMFDGELTVLDVPNDEWDDYWDCVLDSAGRKRDVNLHYEEGMEKVSVAVYELDEFEEIRTDKYERLTVIEIGHNPGFSDDITMEVLSKSTTYTLKHKNKEYLVTHSKDESDGINIEISGSDTVPQEVVDYVNELFDE